MPSRPTDPVDARASPIALACEEAGDTSAVAPGRALLLRAMIAAEIVLGTAILLGVGPSLHGEWHLFLILVALNLAAERFPLSIYGDTVMTVGFAFTLAIMAFFGPAGVAILAPLEAVTRRVGRNPMDVYTARSACRGVIVYSGAAFVYQALSPAGEGMGWEMVPAGLAASAVAFLVNAGLITVSLSLRRGESLRTIWGNHIFLAPNFLALGTVGVALAAAYHALGYWGILSFLIPAFMLRVSMKQYVDKTAENVERLRQQNRALMAANIEVRRVSDELKVTYNATLEALVNALEARDQETKGHSVRVARYMLNIAEALGVKPDTQEWLDMHHGALLHDVGKIGVRDNILLKPGKLDEAEWEVMRKHPEIGYHILREVGFLRGAAEIVLAHHERWDGAGYPKGLRGEEIPLGSRIFSVVDTFDSMTWDRVYRKALTTQEALNEILRCSGSQFDPLVVEAFLDIYDQWVREREQMRDIPEVRAA